MSLENHTIHAEKKIQGVLLKHHNLLQCIVAIEEAEQDNDLVDEQPKMKIQQIPIRQQDRIDYTVEKQRIMAAKRYKLYIIKSTNF